MEDMWTEDMWTHDIRDRPKLFFIFGRNETVPETDILAWAEYKNENITASSVLAENENETECTVSNFEKQTVEQYLFIVL